MLLSFLDGLKELFSGFNVLRYITFRAVMAGISAFMFSVLMGPTLIRALVKWDVRHSHNRKGFREIAAQTPEKAETPTMGGVLIVGSILIACLIWGDLSNRYLWIALISIVWLGVIGFIDDYLKATRGNAKGLLALTKFLGQTILGLSLGVYLYLDAPHWSGVSLPFFKEAVIGAGVLYVFFVCLVTVGSSNAVNLTDGLDGLAIGCSLFIAFTYAIFAYVTGHAIFAGYLFLPYIAGTGELAVFCTAIAGSALGFLWFNSHPATVFMGDTGSLSLGGAIGVVAVLIKKEFILVLVGGIFVIEALSVILQIAGFKMTGKRLFLMAPIHHHFQLKGWSESKIVIRFWIVAVILGLAGIASLKLR